MADEVQLWPDEFPQMATVFASGEQHGRARVTHLTITLEESWASCLQAQAHPLRRGAVGAGTYALLHVKDTLTQPPRLWMSDTNDERSDHRAALRHAHGEALVAGLGLGMVALGMLLRPQVQRVTVLELDADVIGLTEPALRRVLAALGMPQDRLVVHCADVFAWKPPRRAQYDALWFDVWPTLDTDDLAEHARCNRRFARYTAPGGWRGCWAADQLRRRLAHEKREELLWRHVRASVGGDPLRTLRNDGS